MKGCNNIAAHRRDCGLTQEELAAFENPYETLWHDDAVFTPQ